MVRIRARQVRVPVPMSRARRRDVAALFVTPILVPATVAVGMFTVGYVPPTWAFPAVSWAVVALAAVLALLALQAPAIAHALLVLAAATFVCGQLLAGGGWAWAAYGVVALYVLWRVHPRDRRFLP